jgi:hypothetical protein
VWKSPTQAKIGLEWATVQITQLLNPSMGCPYVSLLGAQCLHDIDTGSAGRGHRRCDHGDGHQHNC